MGIPETHYATAADGVQIAYQAFGSGDLDLIYVPGYVSHLEVAWEEPRYARFLHRLASSMRVVILDKRGMGLSDRFARVPDMETVAEDLGVVLDAVGSESAVVWGDGPDGGGTAALYAASHPERTKALIWWGPTARAAWAPDYPWGQSVEEREKERAFIADAWGDESKAGEMLRLIGAPSFADDPEERHFLAKMFRNAATPRASLELDEVWASVDVRGILPSIHVPTLLLDPGSADEADHVGARIAAATVVHLAPRADFPPFLADQEEVFKAIDRFLGSVRSEEAEFDRVLVTVLFTDIVKSTERAAELGDRRWRELLGQHHAKVRALLARYRGREVDTAGDGFLATFDGPARAVRCAQSIIDAVQPLGIEIRAGCHTGEIERAGDDVRGIAVHIGARVAALSEPSEVLVSQTVRDLVAGSGLLFKDRGAHALKGVPDTWHLYAVVRDEEVE